MSAAAAFRADPFDRPSGAPPKRMLVTPALEVTPEIAALASPIEWLFGQALIRCLAALHETGEWHTAFLPRGEVTLWAEFPPLHRQGIIVSEQVEIGGYRADFACLVRRRGWHLCRYAFECDGHEWHEKTPEQARHDKARDRYFLTSHVHPIRYDGSEIIEDPVRCATEAVQIAIILSSPEVRE